MRRALMIAIVAALAVVLHHAEARAGASAGQLVGSFSGTAYVAAVSVNVDADEANNCQTGDPPVPPDATEVCQGQVTISLRQGNSTVSVTFQSPYVANFAFGCDGVNGASQSPVPPLTSNDPAKELAQRRFEGIDWIPTAPASTLLGAFGITYDPIITGFFTFSHITRAKCVQNEEGFWVLLLQGIMQFGDPQ